MGERVCDIEDCANPHLSGGLCRMHYARKRRTGDPLSARKYERRDPDAPAPTRQPRGTCSVNGCDRPHHSGGYCSAHHKQVVAGTALRPLRPYRPRGSACAFDDCDKPVNAAGFCGGHYAQRRDGRPLAPLFVAKPRGVPCELDGCDRKSVTDGLCRTHYGRRLKGEADWDRPVKVKATHGAGHTDAHGYRFVSVNGRKVAEHKVVMERVLGRPMVPGESVHHKHGQRDDNRPHQLELWSKSQPSGQRVADKLVWAMELLAFYEGDPPAVTGLSVEGQVAWHRERLAALGSS